MIAAICSSNVVQILALCSVASLFSLVPQRFWLLLWAGVLCCLLVLFSFIFDIGEVYSYSDFYKRGFWYLGDDVTTWLVPMFIYCILSKRTVCGCLTAGAIFMSGGRIGMVLLLIQIAAICFNDRANWFKIAKTVTGRLVVGLSIYFVAVSVSPHAISIGNKLGHMAGFQENLFEQTRRGYNNCRQGDCLETKFKRPFRMRAFSAVAGLWMTLDGGYPGKRFPNTPEKFAELMVNANPWGINDRFGIDKEDWVQIGTVQSAYLHFGAGYGPFALAVVMLFIGGICVIGIHNLTQHPPNELTAFTVFFIVNATFNQTQTWLLPGPTLFFMAFSGTQILQQFVLTKRGALKSAIPPHAATACLEPTAAGDAAEFKEPALAYRKR